MTSQPTTATRFRDELDQQNADIWSAIYELPFLRDLSDSTLTPERFAFFIAEDMLYLDEFARVLATGAARSSDPDTRQMFLRHAHDIRFVEQELHTTVAPEVGLDPELIRRQDPAPITVAYTDHLHRVAHAGSLAELVAAVLPCYDVYRRVGDHLAGRAPAHPVYARWVASYSSPEFACSVDEQLDLVDRLAPLEGAAVRERMLSHYRRSIRYEWMFWQQAYEGRRWPIGTTDR